MYLSLTQRDDLTCCNDQGRVRASKTAIENQSFGFRIKKERREDRSIKGSGQVWRVGDPMCWWFQSPQGPKWRTECSSMYSLENLHVFMALVMGIYRCREW